MEKTVERLVGRPRRWGNIKIYLRRRVVRMRNGRM